MAPAPLLISFNAEGVAGHVGTPWYPSSIRGRPSRGDRLLRNPIYVGRLRWNRIACVRDPIDGTRVLRVRPAEEIVEAMVPELRIVDDETWARVQARLAAEAAPKRDQSVPAFWERRRPRHLLSGKVFCGACGRGFSAMGQDYLGCLAARSGHGCSNTRWIRRPRLEAQVLDALGRQLMRPDLVEEFCRAFIAEWNAQTAKASAGAEAQRRELQAVERKLENLLEAIADGLKAPGLQRKRMELEARRGQLLAVQVRRRLRCIRTLPNSTPGALQNCGADSTPATALRFSKRRAPWSTV